MQSILRLCFILLLFIPVQARTLLIVGDSISAAFGMQPEEGYVSQLHNRLTEKGYDYTIINASISGDTTSNGLSRLPHLLSTHQPDITVIELGGNDGLRATPPKQIADNLTQMVRMAKAAGSDVVLVGIQLPPNYGQAYLKRFLAIYPDIAAAENIALLPSIVAEAGGNPELMQNDGIHPNAKAQPLLMKAMYEVLLPLLKKDAP
ncbi:arylesterase [Wohlfahrtiimonas chitiniclastica]|uniref:arylesterase n=1 Tax=Wohlfahrtiimonas chitiniclastica TaxID=400946 RepID=UPI000B982579|nr:arylesterase [Wohlfahrtiimonas chitiniclastica]OYQ87440.1 arylesterase [Wohlfahrtiimonas chitiniclastica]